MIKSRRLFKLSIVYIIIYVCIKIYNIFISNVYNIEISDLKFSLLNNVYAQEKKETEAKPEVLGEGANKLIENKSPKDTTSITNYDTPEEVREFVITKDEIKVLKELQSRKEMLDKREAELKIYEDMLKNTENRISKKLREAEALQERLQELLKEYDTKDKEKFASLIKIYEGMKPKDAANILNDFDLYITVKILQGMKTANSASIISLMDPQRAREVSQQMASKTGINLQ
jgi:flagellar motility protein MotE (MotC chaperone)